MIQMLLSLAKAQRAPSFCLNEEHSGKSPPAAREEKRFLYLAVTPACLKQESTGLLVGLSLSFPQGSGGNP
jgi:hypothetical protein